MRKFAIASAVAASAALFGFGCTAEVHGPEAEVGVGVGVDANVEAGGPVIDAPDVVSIDIDPPFEARQYVYDPGFPPGVYLYDGYYYYGDYRYPQDEFVNRYVQENVRRGRFTDANDNRQRAQQAEQRQRTEFARTGGHHTANRTPVQHNDANKTQRPDDRATKENPDRAKMTAEQQKAAENQRPAKEQPVARPEERKTEPREEHPAAQPEEKTATPREEHPAARTEERKTEPRNDAPNGVHQPATPGEKEKPEDRNEQK